MEIITGAYNTAKVFTKTLEPSARSQIQALCDCEVFKDSNMVFQPDVHTGAGCTIGTVMTVTDKIVPYHIGVDISCGMLCVNLGQANIDLPKFDEAVKRNVPSGMDIRKKPHCLASSIKLEELLCFEKVAATIPRAYKSVGTLGGGNHFIELSKDDDGDVYLVIHSGSRNIGKQVAEHYQTTASSHFTKEELKPDFHYLTGNEMAEYLNDVQIMRRFAHLNRTTIAISILENCEGLSGISNTLDFSGDEKVFTTEHNYIDGNIIRKGAVSAKAGEKILIPLNMRDGSLICEGLGNEEWLCSAPHGAGRVMGRGQAKRTLNVDEFVESMRGIYTTTANETTLDEAPMCYKQTEEILEAITPTAKVLKRLKPIYNFKAQETRKRHRGFTM